MAGRIAATHRWCVTGTPLSPERGLVDAHDLLRFLRCDHPLASSRLALLHSLRSDGGAELLALLRRLMWRTSKAHVAAASAMMVRRIVAAAAKETS